MSFTRNTVDRCLRGDSVDGFFCSCAMVSSCSDVRGWMDPSVRGSCIRTQDAGVLSRLEISVRRLALVDEKGSRSRIRIGNRKGCYAAAPASRCLQQNQHVGRRRL
jgi:hypothetical protein